MRYRQKQALNRYNTSRRQYGHLNDNQIKKIIIEVILKNRKVIIWKSCHHFISYSKDKSMELQIYR